MDTTSDTFEYFATHESVRDGSTAMCKSQTWDTITLINEDGDIWTDPMNQWVRLEVIDYPASYYDEECGFCQQTDCDGDCEPEDDDYHLSYDYPEYDPQTAFYEATGRMQFPNEY